MSTYRAGKGLACALLTALAWPQTVSASGGTEQARFASEHGHAAGATPFAIYYNPAALALGSRLQIAGNLTLAWHGASYDRSQTTSPDPPMAPGANVGQAKVSNALAAPAFAASYRLGDFGLGVGVFVPFAGMQSWAGGGQSYPEYPGTRDGSARWHLIEGGTSSLYTSLGASYTIRPLRLSVGVSGNLVYNSLSFTRAQNGLGDDNIATEGRSYLDVHGVTGSFGLGLLWEAIEKKTWIGVSYQAPPGLYKDLSMDGKLRLLLGGTTPSTSNVSLKQSMPDIVRWALRVRPTERYELRLFGDVTRWSTFDRQCLVRKGGHCRLNPDGSAPANSDVVLNQPRNWQNTFAIHASGSYYFSPSLEALGGIAYDSNAVPASTLDPSLIDGNDLTYTLGGRARFAETLGLLVALSYQQWLERNTNGKSTLDLEKVPSRLPNSGGIYHQQAVVLNMMFEFYLQ